jgi:hypothetical protein
MLPVTLPVDDRPTSKKTGVQMGTSGDNLTDLPWKRLSKGRDELGIDQGSLARPVQAAWCLAPNRD